MACNMKEQLKRLCWPFDVHRTRKYAGTRNATTRSGSTAPNALLRYLLQHLLQTWPCAYNLLLRQEKKILVTFTNTPSTIAQTPRYVQLSKLICSHQRIYLSAGTSNEQGQHRKHVIHTVLTQFFGKSLASTLAVLDRHKGRNVRSKWCVVHTRRSHECVSPVVWSLWKFHTEHDTDLDVDLPKSSELLCNSALLVLHYRDVSTYKTLQVVQSAVLCSFHAADISECLAFQSFEISSTKKTADTEQRHNKYSIQTVAYALLCSRCNFGF